MEIIDKIKEKTQRHIERHTALDYQYIFSDSISFVNAGDWDAVAHDSSIFLSRGYLTTIENNSPENTVQRYALAYSDGEPIAIVVCQLAEISGESLFQSSADIAEKLTGGLRERVLVCGNLVSSGLHGVAFSPHLSAEEGWKIVAEILYKIRRAEKLSGQIDFVLIKDISEAELAPSQTVERYSYRRIQTDPDMVIEFEADANCFEGYLTCLNSKYRNRIRKVIKKLDQAQFLCEKLVIDTETDRLLHRLYLEVENRSKTRLATLPVGYFNGLYESLGSSFCCYGIKKNNEIVGFITIIKDGPDAISYYVGINYDLNSEYPVYFRLLQLAVQAALEMGCSRIQLGRTALEPKASLGALPVDTFVWARHRVPIVNFMVRKLFRNIPYDVAPERNARK